MNKRCISINIYEQQINILEIILSLNTYGDRRMSGNPDYIISFCVEIQGQ